MLHPPYKYPPRHGRKTADCFFIDFPIPQLLYRSSNEEERMNWLPRPSLPGKKPRSHQCRLHVIPDFQTVIGIATAEMMKSTDRKSNFCLASSSSSATFLVSILEPAIASFRRGGPDAESEVDCSFSHWSLWGLLFLALGSSSQMNIFLHLLKPGAPRI